MLAAFPMILREGYIAAPTAMTVVSTPTVVATSGSTIAAQTARASGVAASNTKALNEKSVMLVVLQAQRQQAAIKIRGNSP